MPLIDYWLEENGYPNYIPTLDLCEGYQQESLEEVLDGAKHFSISSMMLFIGGSLVVYRVEHVALRLSPDHSIPGSIPARGHLLNVLPSISHTYLSISL